MPLKFIYKHSILKQVLKKKSAFISFCIICIYVLLAVFAYFIVPDQSNNANTMIVELGAKPLFFSKEFLFIPKLIDAQPINNIRDKSSVKETEFQLLPINNFCLLKDSIKVSHYIDEGISDIKTFPLLLFSIKDSAGFVEKYIHIKTFYLGTDRFGRDILSRIIIGSRVSLSVGFVAVILSLLLGILMGSLAGYFGGFIDKIIVFIINILWSIPTLLLVFAITLTVGKGFIEIFVAIGLTMWVSAARLVRGQVMSIKELDYITAAKSLGANHWRIIFKHVLPNIAGPIMVIAASNFATAILIEAGLSFLGFGIQPPQPSWGLMIKEHFNFLITNRPFLALLPGFAILSLVYSFNIIGNTLRDVLDVKDQ